MKTLLSKVKMEALSIEQMAQITGGDDCLECYDTYVNTYYSNSDVVEMDPSGSICIPCT